MSLKKILAVAMCATVVSATGAMMASAEGAAPVNLMPGDVSAITCGAGGSVEEKDGALVFKAGSADTSFTYALNADVDLLATEWLYFDLTATGGWDIKWTSTALNGDLNPGVSADFGNYFGKDNASPETTFGTLIESGTYVTNEELMVGIAGAYTWNNNLPDDGIVTMKAIEIKVGANSELTLKSLYLGDPEAASADPGTATTNDADAPAATTAGSAAATTAAGGNSGTTNPATGESTVMVASGIVLTVVSAGAVALTMKKKAQ